MSVRDRFVAGVLRDAGQRLLKSQGAAVQKSVQLRSGRILSARNVAVSGGAEMDGKLSYTHTAYERFLDMKRVGGVKRRKRRRIHNRFVYGAYASVAERLMYGFTEDVKEMFRKLEEGNE